MNGVSVRVVIELSKRQDPEVDCYFMDLLESEAKTGGNGVETESLSDVLLLREWLYMHSARLLITGSIVFL